MTNLSNLTTFAGERRVLTIGREALVCVKRPAGQMGHMLVAITRDGFRTDYPMAYDSGQVVYNHPEWFSRRFKERAAPHVRRFYGKD